MTCCSRHSTSKSTLDVLTSALLKGYLYSVGTSSGMNGKMLCGKLISSDCFQNNFKITFEVILEIYPINKCLEYSFIAATSKVIRGMLIPHYVLQICVGISNGIDSHPGPQKMNIGMQQKAPQLPFSHYFPAESLDGGVHACFIYSCDSSSDCLKCKNVQTVIRLPADAFGY